MIVYHEISWIKKLEILLLLAIIIRTMQFLINRISTNERFLPVNRNSSRDPFGLKTYMKTMDFRKPVDYFTKTRQESLRKRIKNTINTNKQGLNKIRKFSKESRKIKSQKEHQSNQAKIIMPFSKQTSRNDITKYSSFGNPHDSRFEINPGVSEGKQVKQKLAYDIKLDKILPRKSIFNSSIGPQYFPNYDILTRKTLTLPFGK